MYNDNGQRPTQGAQPIHSVRSTRQMIGKVNSIVGWALFGAGAIVFALGLFFDNRAAVISLLITGGSLAFSGLVNVFIGMGFRSSARREQEKLARLKAEGQAFPAEISRVHQHMGVHIGHKVSAYIECTYKNQDGAICLVKSSSFLHSPSDSYSAWVYVNPFDPRDYAVEVAIQAPETQAVHDYR
ncbi:MAG: hypothetical protein FWC78_05120 [Defluviitaleaceae bacterium]|nr:hypothetical protein [Defluviitaleaceae bacterium]